MFSLSPTQTMIHQNIPFISMAQCKNAVTPVHCHWSYCRLALSPRYDGIIVIFIFTIISLLPLEDNAAAENGRVWSWQSQARLCRTPQMLPWSCNPRPLDAAMNTHHMKFNEILGFRPLLYLVKLTHWGLVTSYGDRDLGQHWLR